MPETFSAESVKIVNSSSRPFSNACLVLACLFALCCIVWSPSSVIADELEMVNHPCNVNGLTGLLFTTTPYTMPKRTFELGVAAVSENSHQPDYTLDRYPVFATYGLTDDMEMSARTSYVTVDYADTKKSRGSGDASVSWKWNFRQQQEDSVWPAVSLFMTGILPSGDSVAGTNSIEHWGLRLGLSVGSEIPIADYILGLYADGQLAVQDLSDGMYRDRYQLFNAGVLFPISKYRNLQMFLEYNAMGGADVIYQNITNYTAVTYGLRLVSSRFNLTFGAELIHRTRAGFEDLSRVVSMMSFKL